MAQWGVSLQTIKTSNNDLYSLAFGIVSMFFYGLFIFQALAIYFGIKGIQDSKVNLSVSKWKSTIGLILGFVYLGAAILQLFIKV